MNRRIRLITLMLILSAAGLFLCSAASKAVCEYTITYLSRGQQIPATVVFPAGKSDGCPVVIMAHGHHGSRNERFGFPVIARALARCGIASIRMDFSGCGESNEPFTENRLTNMKADVLAATAYARETLSAPVVGLFGYSMGGRIVLELLAEGAAPDAAAMLAPAADTADLARTFGGIERLAQLHAAAQKDGFAAHSESEIMGLGWFEDLLRYDDPAAAAAMSYHGPALVLYGSDDGIVAPEVALHAAQALGAKTLDVGGKGHGYGFFREDDELLLVIAQAVSAFFAEHLL